MSQLRLQARLNKLIEDRIKLLEKEVDLQKQANQSTSTAERHLTNVQKIQRRVNDVFDYGSSVLKRYAGMLTTVALAHKAYDIVTSSSKGSTEQFLLTAQSLDKASTSYAAIAGRAKAYQKVVQQDIRLAERYGLELEHVRQVSNSWMKTLRFTGKFGEKQIRQVKDLTDRTLVYAKVLGIDTNELVQKASHRMFQYGEGAGTALDNMVGLYSATQVVNKQLKDITGNHTFLWAEDFGKLVEEAGSNTQNFTQDVNLLSAAMAESVKNAAKAGQAYNATLEAGRAMGKFITGGGENAMSSVIGLRMLERMKKSRGKDGKLSEEFLKDFNQTQRADMQRVADMIGTTNERDLSLYLADSTATSKAGIRELLKLTEELGSKTGDIVPILESQRGLTRAQAIEMAHQLKSAKSMDEVLNNITAQYDAQKQETATLKDNAEGMTAIMRAEAGKVTTIPWLDATIERFDDFAGRVKAHFADAGTVMKYAFVAGLVGLVQFMRAAKSLQGTMGSIAAAAKTIASSTQVAAQSTAAQASAQRSAGGVASRASGALRGGSLPPIPGTSGMLAPFATGNALRVFVVNQPRGGMATGGGRGGGPAQRNAPVVVPGVPATPGEPRQSRRARRRAARGNYEPPVVEPMATPTTAKPGWRSRLSGLGSNPMAMMAALMAADYMLAPSEASAEELDENGNPIAKEPSTLETMKGYGRTALNGAMIWSMLGMPGKETIGNAAKGVGGFAKRLIPGGAGAAGGLLKKLAARFAMRGAAQAGVSAASTATSTAVSTAGAGTAWTTAGGILGEVSLLGGAAAAGAGLLAALMMYAPAFLIAKSNEMPEKLRNLSKMMGRPLNIEDISDQSRNEVLQYLAEHPDETRELVNDGVILGRLASPTVQSSTEALRDSAKTATAAQVYSGYTTTTSSRMTVAGASAPKIIGAKGSGNITNVSPDGRTRVVVPMEIEIQNGMALPAAYDKAKSATQ